MASKRMTKTEITRARKQLWAAAERVNAPCLNRWDEFASEDLPSEEEAATMCSGCPLVNQQCQRYLDTGEPVWGVYAGQRIDKYGFDEEEDDDEQ